MPKWIISTPRSRRCEQRLTVIIIRRADRPESVWFAMRISHPVSKMPRFARQQRFFLLILGLVLCYRSAFAQQPFITDDADVTPPHKFHFEFSNEFDVLPRASFPNLKQNTADAELDYGLFNNFEVGLEAPVLTIMNDRSAPFRGQLQSC